MQAKVRRSKEDGRATNVRVQAKETSPVIHYVYRHKWQTVRIDETVTHKNIEWVHLYFEDGEHGYAAKSLIDIHYEYAGFVWSKRQDQPLTLLWLDRQFPHYSNRQGFKDAILNLDGIPVKWTSAKGFELPAPNSITKLLGWLMVIYADGSAIALQFRAGYTEGLQVTGAIFCFVTNDTRWTQASYHDTPSPHVTLGAYQLSSDEWSSFARALKADGWLG